MRSSVLIFVIGAAVGVVCMGCDDDGGNGEDVDFCAVYCDFMTPDDDCTPDPEMRAWCVEEDCAPRAAAASECRSAYIDAATCIARYDPCEVDAIEQNCASVLASLDRTQNEHCPED